ncbi:hypothetical protein NBRC116188_29760 [Oceaniserpentilla sp. 4NH20-0058]|uniref:hypothetical protein n=1 Tax=Oceaniserpentilla sp. 4NH20-0058 TaxID=3127660 RepID=UPI0031080D9C
MNKWILISPMLFGLIACGSGSDSETRFEEQLLGQWEQPCTPQQGNSASKMTMELSISKAIISQINYSDSSCEFPDIESSLHGSYTVEP